MATLILRPTGAGFYTQLTPSAGANWENVDEESQDGDATYNQGNTSLRDTFVTGGGVPAGATYISVELVIWAKASTTPGTLLIGYLRLAGEDSDLPLSPFGYVATSYTAYSVVMDLSPSSAPWTPDEVNALELGYQVQVVIGTVNVTQAYLVVTYTAPAVPIEGDGASEFPFPVATASGATVFGGEGESEFPFPAATALGSAPGPSVGMAAMSFPFLVASGQGNSPTYGIASTSFPFLAANGEGIHIEYIPPEPVIAPVAAGSGFGFLNSRVNASSLWQARAAEVRARIRQRHTPRYPGRQR